MLGFYPLGSEPIGSGDVASGAPGGGGVGADVIAPTLTGVLTYSVTSSSITVSWASTTSADNVAVARHEFRIGGAGAYMAASAGEEVSKSHVFAGLAANSSYQVDVRCVDTSGNVSTALTIGATTAAPSGEGSAACYIRCTLATHEGVPHVNLGTLCWALFAQLSPAQFGSPVAKGKHTMAAGSANVEIAVSASTVPAGWYFLVLSDEDGTTALAAPILVGP